MRSYKLYRTNIKRNFLEPKALANKPSQKFRNNPGRIPHRFDRGKYKTQDEDGITQNLRPCSGLIKTLKLNRFIESLNPRRRRLIKILKTAEVESLSP
jgi:hypothetical protein